jgi:hypothetical protein
LTRSGIAILVIIGIIVGFASSSVSKFLSGSEAAIALVVALTTSAAIVAIYALIISSQSRDQILLLSLSAIIGSVGYYVLAPTSSS